MKNDVQIISLNGSPNKNGSTAKLIDWVAEGAKRHGAEISKYHISDLSINYCRGCNSCLRTGKCIIADDLDMILQKIELADGIIVGSPVYGGRPTAQLKTLIDRITLLKLYTGIFEDKISVGVATSGIAPTRKVARDSAIIFGRVIKKIGIKCANLKQGYVNLTEKDYPNEKQKAIEIGMK